MSTLRTSIVIIFALITLVYSATTVINENDIKQLKAALHESAKHMRREARDENVAICIGATRSGKSTLINYVIGNNLKAVQLLRGFPITIVKENNTAIGPAIGSGSTSKTKIPTKWTSKKLPDLIIWDAPGFEDNRGTVQDIINAFYLYQLVQNVKSLKIVLVVDIDDILKDNIRSFISVLQAAENLLGNKMKHYFTSISVIFTKVPNTLNGAPVDTELIGDILSYKFSSGNEMYLSEITKEYVQYLIENKNRIAFFKRPEIGLLTSAVDVNIFLVIKNSTSVPKDQLQTLNPSISDSSKLALFKIRDILNPKSVFVDLENLIRAISQNRIHELENLIYNNETELQIRTLNKELISLQNRLFDAMSYENDFYRKMEILETTDPAIKKKIEDQNLLEKIKLMEFVDRLLDFKESEELALNLQRVLMSSYSGLKETISTINVRLGEITQQKHNEIIKKEREEYLKHLKKLNEDIAIVKAGNDAKHSFWEDLLSYTPVILYLVSNLG